MNADYKRADLEARMIAFEAFGALIAFSESEKCPEYLREMAADYETRMAAAKAQRDRAREAA
jgi:hypothetical protein